MNVPPSAHTTHKALLRAVLCLAFGLLAASGMASSDSPRLDPNATYLAARQSPVTYDVDLSIVVTPPYRTKRLRVWLPLPPSDHAQEVSDSRLETFPDDVTPTLATEAVHGNRFAHFEFANPLGAQVIRHRFRVKTWELRWNVDPAQVAAVTEWPKSFDRYRRGEDQAVVVDGRFEKVLAEINPRRGSAVADLGAVMTWVNRNFTYDHVDASLRADSRHGLEKRRGHCSDYHGFCAALGRALGSPTRVVYGINPFPKNSPSHCKLEAYLPPYGWVEFDVSETQKLQAAILKDVSLSEAEKSELVAAAQNRMLRGFRDNTWFLQTRGTDYDLAPPASQKVPVVRTAWIEADGKPLPDPDPANPQQREFAWMTVAKFQADRTVPNPFLDHRTLSTWR